jgi:NAD(P)-dependent dehydrogenase (short-subunit alcohol dehydrogenase family)
MATKNVLITGGSRGLGKHLTHVFARRGHRVVTTYRNSPPSLHHPNVKWLHCDLTDVHDVQHMMDATAKDFDQQFDIVHSAKSILQHLEVSR